MSRLGRIASPSRLPLLAALAFLAAVVLLPLGGLAAATVFGPDGFTIEAWRALAEDQNALTQLSASLQLGLAATTVSLLLGGLHAWVRCSSRAATPRLWRRCSQEKCGSL